MGWNLDEHVNEAFKSLILYTLIYAFIIMSTSIILPNNDISILVIAISIYLLTDLFIIDWSNENLVIQIDNMVKAVLYTITISILIYSIGITISEDPLEIKISTKRIIVLEGNPMIILSIAALLSGFVKSASAIIKDNTSTAGGA